MLVKSQKLFFNLTNFPTADMRQRSGQNLKVRAQHFIGDFTVETEAPPQSNLLIKRDIRA